MRGSVCVVINKTVALNRLAVHCILINKILHDRVDFCTKYSLSVPSPRLFYGRNDGNKPLVRAQQYLSFHIYGKVPEAMFLNENRKVFIVVLESL